MSEAWSNCRQEFVREFDVLLDVQSLGGGRVEKWYDIRIVGPPQ